MSTKLFVKYESYCTDSNYSDEPFGDWNTEHCFTIEGVSLSKDEDYQNEEFVLPQEIGVGGHVYVLSMIYSTGDSFGESTGNGEIIWVFPTHELAKAAKDIWKFSKQFSIEFEIGDGHKKTLSNPSAGYFERQESIEIQSFVVTK